MTLLVFTILTTLVFTVLQLLSSRFYNSWLHGCTTLVLTVLQLNLVQLLPRPLQPKFNHYVRWVLPRHTQCSTSPYLDNHPLFITDERLPWSTFEPFGGLPSWFAPLQLWPMIPRIWCKFWGVYSRNSSLFNMAQLFAAIFPISHCSPPPHGPTPTLHPTILCFNMADLRVIVFGLYRFFKTNSSKSLYFNTSWPPAKRVTG